MAACTTAAVSSSRKKTIFDFHFFIGQFVDAWNGLGQTPLFVAAYLMKYETVSMLLNIGADPNVSFYSRLNTAGQKIKKNPGQKNS